MFETLFRYPAIVARHQGGRFAAARELFLNQCAGQGMALAEVMACDTANYRTPDATLGFNSRGDRRNDHQRHNRKKTHHSSPWQFGYLPDFTQHSPQVESASDHFPEGS